MTQKNRPSKRGRAPQLTRASTECRHGAQRQLRRQGDPLQIELVLQDLRAVGGERERERERERGERERDGGRERATDRRADHERDIAGQSSTNEKDCRGTPAKQRMCPWQARMRVPHMWNLPLLSSCTNRVSPDLSPPPCGAGESAHRGHSLEGSGWNTTKHT